MKKTFRCSVVVALVAGILAVAASSPVTPVSAKRVKATPRSGMYKISSASFEGAPPGCVYNCPTVKSTYPSIETQTNFSELASATRIESSPYYYQSGYTVHTCAIFSDSSLKCKGSNTWGELGDGTTTANAQFVSAVSAGAALTQVTDISTGSIATCAIAAARLRCIGHGFTTTQTAWKDYGVGAVKVSIGANHQYLNNLPTQRVCVLTATPAVLCAWVNSDTVVPNWTTFTATGATSVVIGDTEVCVSAVISKCATFAVGSAGFTDYRDIIGGENGEALYATPYRSICVYGSGAVSCGSTSGTSTTIQLSLIGVMPKPDSIISSNPQGGGLDALLFISSTGILYTSSCRLYSVSCGNQSNVATVAAFTDSSATSYNYVTRVNAVTNNFEYLNLTVESSTRKMRSLVPFVVKTASGETLAGSSVKWAAPDAPGILASSKSSLLTSDAIGEGRTTLPTGPVAFTLQYGVVASGAELQATSLTLIVPETGTVNIVVPDPPAIVDRKISVTLPDNSPVPNATITLKNNYIVYAYQSSSSGTSVWSSTPKDNSGFMGNIGCAYCYVAPPVYVTGDDGSVTFRSFAPTVRSSISDAAIGYDDGELSQTVNYNFTDITSTVQLSFMAQLALVIADKTPATPEIDLNTNASGTIDIPAELKDENGTPISMFEATAEEVCDTMDTGGLFSSTDNVDSLCTSNVKEKSVETAIVSSSGVRAMGINTSAACSTKKTAITDSSGKAKIRLCVKKSTKLRVRGKGALGSRSFCLRVNGKPCAATVPTTNMGSRLMSANTTPAMRSLIKPVGKGAVSYSVPNNGQCRKSPSNKLVVEDWVQKEAKKNPVYSCTVTMMQKRSGKNPATKKTLTLLLR
jgi:hypothetical protein